MSLNASYTSDALDAKMVWAEKSPSPETGTAMVRCPLNQAGTKETWRAKGPDGSPRTGKARGELLLERSKNLWREEQRERLLCWSDTTLDFKATLEQHLQDPDGLESKLPGRRSLRDGCGLF